MLALVPVPVTRFIAAFNCAGEGNIENGEGRPEMKHHVPIDIGYVYGYGSLSSRPSPLRVYVAF